MGNKVKGKWSKNIPKCEELEPDCFNCPHPDCIAGFPTIIRQEAFREKQNLQARNREIYEKTKAGYGIEYFQTKYELTENTIKKIILAERKKIGKEKEGKTQRIGAG